MGIEDYLEAQRRNLDETRRLPHWNLLIKPVYELYELSFKLVPGNAPPVFPQGLLMCNSAFLSAAALIARTLPDDAAGVMRRAIEIARVSRAIKHDPKNFDFWAAYEKRLARWQDRGEDRRPPRPIKPKLTYPDNHPLLERLSTRLGILSDTAVHFTPEFAITRDWRVAPTEYPHTARLELQFFQTDQRVIEREMLLLAADHLTILQLFDECFDGKFSADARWTEKFSQVQKDGKMFSRRFSTPTSRDD